MIPAHIKVFQKTKLMQLEFETGDPKQIPFAVLRQHSPSAENKGEHAVQDFSEVTVTALEPVGNYGVKITFSDGHDTGIYRFELLASLAE